VFFTFTKTNSASTVIKAVQAVFLWGGQYENVAITSAYYVCSDRNGYGGVYLFLASLIPDLIKSEKQQRFPSDIPGPLFFCYYIRLSGSKNHFFMGIWIYLLT
jgi:hypothetical protein